MLEKTEVSKKQWRTEFKRRRDEFVKEFAPTRAQLEAQISSYILSLLPASAHRVAAYMACGSEVSLSPLFEQRPNVEWVFPRVERDGTLSFYKPPSIDSMSCNSWGIAEPDPESSELVELNQCEVCLVPGLIFDRAGFRIGYGKGFYDKALSQFKGHKIGVAFSVQIAEQDLPRDSFDIPVDDIVTENYILQTSIPRRTH